MIEAKTVEIDPTIHIGIQMPKVPGRLSHPHSTVPVRFLFHPGQKTPNLSLAGPTALQLPLWRPPADDPRYGHVCNSSTALSGTNGPPKHLASRCIPFIKKNQLLQFYIVLSVPQSCCFLDLEVVAQWNNVEMTKTWDLQTRRYHTSPNTKTRWIFRCKFEWLKSERRSVMDFSLNRIGDGPWISWITIKIH
jgi:hypothetical protein